MERITFKPLRVRRLSQVIEHDIRALILKGEIKPGERLPSEKEIGKQFGVSSVTVRESLRALEAFGFIKKKRGRGGGIFVTDTSADSAKIPLYNILRKRDFSERHVAELRTIIEPVAVKIAAPQITSGEIKLKARNKCQTL